jgi:release factor glutamine methyltransferase
MRMTLNMTVAMLLAEGAAQLDAELLLAYALGVPRTRLRSHPEAAVEPGAVQHFRALLDRRRAGEPAAYLIGRKEFWSLELLVTEAVLVPRPETELLVERALALAGHESARVADLGTGSGAVALALASERPRWQVVATDVSDAALALARANARALGLGRVEFRHGSWLEALAGERYDLIVSNPPYVAVHDPALHELQYEPQLALAAGGDGLDALREIVRGAPAHLAAGGWLALEHGADQGAAVRRELALAGLRYIRSHRDLAGRERVTEGQQ